jgi:hypothetical protein
MAVIFPRNPGSFIGGALAALHDVVFLTFAVAQFHAGVAAEWAPLHTSIHGIVSGISTTAQSFLVIPDVCVITNSLDRNREKVNLAAAQPDG